MLLNAAFLGDPGMYDCSYHFVIVIDGDGIVQYRGSANGPALQIVIQDAIDRMRVGVGVGDTPGAAALLGANYPNPFNPTTSIPFEVPAPSGAASVRLDVLDLRGRIVRTLIDGPRPAGRHVAAFDGRDRAGDILPSGAYAARLRVGGVTETRIMTLVK